MPLSALTQVGAGKETVWGTGVVSEHWLPVEPPTINLTIGQILEQGLRGVSAKDFAAYAGVKAVEGSISGAAYPEELGILLLSLFGTEGVAGTAAPYAHTFSSAGTAPSLSLEISDSVQARRFLGCEVNSLTLTFNAAEGLLTYNADIIGRDMELITAGTYSGPASQVWQGWRADLTLGGSAFDKVISAEMTFAREVQLTYALNNTQLASFRDIGPMEVSGRMTVYFNAEADYNRFLNKTQDALVMTLTYGAGTGVRTLAITCTVMDYGDGPAEIDRSGINLALNFTLRGLYNTTDAGPAKIVLSNARATAY